MGYEYYIACKGCKKFVDFGRWRVFHDFQFPDASRELFAGAGNVAASSVSGECLRERLRLMDDPFSLNNKENPNFQKLMTVVVEFCNEHEEHELYFINDSGDFPWSVCECDRFPWYEWAEVIGPNTDVTKIDLPKNLIRDLHLKSWSEIEKHLLKSYRYDPVDFPGDIALVKYGFEKVHEE